MKLLVVLVSLLVAAESSRLQSYNLPNQSERTFNQGTSSFGGQKGISTSSFGGQKGISPVSFGHGTSGLTTSSFVQGTSRLTPSSTQYSGGRFTSSNQGFTSPPITSCGAGQILHVDGRCVTLQDHSGGAQQVIEVPAPPKKNPEVFFVNYGNGENPILFGGIDLQTALASAQQGLVQVIGDGHTTGGTSGTRGGKDGSTGESIIGGNFVTSDAAGVGGQGGSITTGDSISNVGNNVITSNFGSPSVGGTVSGGTLSHPTGLYTPP